MFTTAFNVLCCIIGILLGVYTFIKHLNGFNHGKTPVVEAWLVVLGSLAWTVSLYSTLDPILMHQAYDHDRIGLSSAETLGNALFLIYWIGMLLQVQKHCLKIKLRKRKLERSHETYLGR